MISSQVTDNSSVGEIRRAVTKVANTLNFPEVLIANLCIIAVEAANNLVKYATRGGEMIISYYQIKQEFGIINIFALDKGPGLSILANAFWMAIQQ